MSDTLRELWFDLERVCWLRDERRVVIPLQAAARRRRQRLPAGSLSFSRSADRQVLRLDIAHVTGMNVADRAGIGTYELQEIGYDPGDRAIAVRSSFPPRFGVYVSAISVSLVG